jgi:hypothetical protein
MKIRQELQCEADNDKIRRQPVQQHDTHRITTNSATCIYRLYSRHSNK